MGHWERYARRIGARYGGQGYDDAPISERYLIDGLREVERLREQLEGAVEAARAAVDYLDELTVYWEVESLPPEVADRFDAVRDALNAVGGQ